MKVVFGEIVFDLGEGFVVGDVFDKVFIWSVDMVVEVYLRLWVYFVFYLFYICFQLFFEQVVVVVYDMGCGIYMYFFEDQWQVDELFECYGLMLVQYFELIGVFEVLGGFVVVYILVVDEWDLEIFEECGVCVLYCFIIYVKFVMLMFLFVFFFEWGIMVGFVIDGLVLNVDMDMFVVVCQIVLFQKYFSFDFVVVFGDMFLCMVMLVGVEIVGFFESGCFEVGGFVDLIFVCMDVVYMMLQYDFVVNFVYLVKGVDVIYMMVDGQWFMCNCELVIFDEEKIVVEVQVRVEVLVEWVWQVCVEVWWLECWGMDFVKIVVLIGLEFIVFVYVDVFCDDVEK